MPLPLIKTVGERALVLVPNASVNENTRLVIGNGTSRLRKNVYRQGRQDRERRVCVRCAKEKWSFHFNFSNHLGVLGVLGVLGGSIFHLNSDISAAC